MTHPKLYAQVNIRFWSLRDSIESDLGDFSAVDTQVVRKCRRVLHRDDWNDTGWKWQIVNYQRDSICNWPMQQDKDILDQDGSELEYEVIK